MSKGKLLAGAVIGAAAGVVAGILTAPKSGRETREDIKTKANEMKHKAGDIAHDVEGKARDVASMAGSKVREVQGKMNKEIDKRVDRR